MLLSKMQVSKLVCALWCLVGLSEPGLSFSMTQDVYHAFAAPQASLTLACKADDAADFCKFYRPDGQLVCISEDEEFSVVKDESCITDPAATTRLDKDGRCLLEINRMDPEQHLGEWRCILSSWTSTASAKVVVATEEPTDVAFYHVYQNVLINVAYTTNMTFQCGVFNPESKFSPLTRSPGMMTWKLNGKELSRSAAYDKDRNGNFNQKIWLQPITLQTDQKNLTCETESGHRDTVQLHVLLLQPNDPEAAVEIAEDVEGNPITITRSFKAFPKPESYQIFWSLADRKIPMDNSDHDDYSGAKLTYTGKYTYEASLTLKTPKKVLQNKWTLFLDVTVGRELSENIQIPVDLRPASGLILGSKTVLGAVAPVDDGFVVSPEEAEADIEKKVREKVYKESVSLYIIIAVIALVVVLCALFYCFKKKAPPKPEPRKQQEKSVEETKPFIISSGSTRLDDSEAAWKTEAKLQQKLDLSTEDRYVTVPSKSVQKLPDDLGFSEENEEIIRMASTIRSYKNDSSQDRVSLRSQDIPLTPTFTTFAPPAIKGTRRKPPPYPLNIRQRSFGEMETTVMSPRGKIRLLDSQMVTDSREVATQTP